MGFTVLQAKDEFGDDLATFVLPIALTEAQQAEVRHGSDATDIETYFYVDAEHDPTDEGALDSAYEFLAQVHVIDVKNGLFEASTS